MKISKDSVVSLEYRIHFGDGELVESTGPGEPIAFIQGKGQIVPGLERALEGLSAGDVCQVVLAPEDAYGNRDEAGVQEVPRSAFPRDLEPRAGMELSARNEHGDAIPYVIREVRPQTVVIDLNHPLAGKALHVDAKVLAVRPATPDELAHAHAHEPGSRHYV
jgi:FKBP-type peptidyl-prolyl cis-trans isomerase SlyD